MVDPRARFEISAEDKTSAAFNQVNSRLKTMETGFGSLGKVASASLGFFSVGLVTGFAKSIFEAADAVGDMSARLGVSASELSKLKYIANQSDVEFQSLAIGIKTFQKNLDDTSPALNELGLSAEKIKELSLTQQFEALAVAFKNIENPSDRVRISMELFGKAGVDLIPFLDQGPEGMRKFAAEAERLGVVLSDKTVKGINDADAAIKRLKSSMEGIGASAIGNTILGMEAFGEAIAKMVHGEADPAKRNLQELNKSLEDRRDILRQIARITENEVGLSGPVTARAVGELKELGEDLARIEQNISRLNNQGLGLSGFGAAAAKAPTVTGITFATPELEVETQADINRRLKIEQEFADRKFAIHQMVNEALYQADVDGSALYSFLQTEKGNILIKSEEFNLAQVQDFSSQRMQIAAAEVQYSLRLAEQEAAERKRIQQSLVSSATGALSAIANSELVSAKKRAGINKALAMAQAIQNTYTGATLQLSSGDPYTAVFRAGLVVAFGLAQVAAIAKTDYGASAGGAPTSPGGFANPIYTSQSGNADGTQGATTKSAVQVYITGNYGWDDYINGKVIAGIQEAVSDRDVVIISPNSRQAQELMPA